MKLEKTKVNSFLYLVSFNGEIIGRAIMDVDGYFYFWFERKDGCSSEHTLRAIADILHDLNKDWDKHIQEYFENESKRSIKNSEHS